MEGKIFLQRQTWGVLLDITRWGVVGSCLGGCAGMRETLMGFRLHPNVAPTHASAKFGQAELDLGLHTFLGCGESELVS